MSALPMTIAALMLLKDTHKRDAFVRVAHMHDNLQTIPKTGSTGWKQGELSVVMTGRQQGKSLVETAMLERWKDTQRKAGRTIRNIDGNLWCAADQVIHDEFSGNVEFFPTTPQWVADMERDMDEQLSELPSNNLVERTTQ